MLATRMMRAATLLFHQARAIGWQYSADQLAVGRTNLGFLHESDFEDAWAFAERGNRDAWAGAVPDIRWRAHIACWAARHASHLDGDFVECGVFAGLLSMTICRLLQFEKMDRRFYLIDTFEGVPESDIKGRLSPSMRYMQALYEGTYDIAARNFSDYPNAVLVKGRIPEILDGMDLPKVAYLSIDLNNAAAEVAAMEFFWERLVPGALVVFDDYGWDGHYEEQHRALKGFADDHGVSIATLPTRQGLMIKPPPGGFANFPTRS